MGFLVLQARLVLKYFVASDHFSFFIFFASFSSQLFRDLVMGFKEYWTQFFFRADIFLSKVFQMLHVDRWVTKDLLSYQSRVYFRVGNFFRKQRCMFSECEFHMNSSVNWKQLGHVDQVKFDFNCASLYVRYRILASGFFQLKLTDGHQSIHNDIPYANSHLYSVLFHMWNKKEKLSRSSSSISKKSITRFFQELKFFKVGWEFKLLFWLNKICFFLPQKCAFGDWIKRIKLMFWILEFKTISWFLLWFYPYYFYSHFSRINSTPSHIEWLPKKLKNETR